MSSRARHVVEGAVLDEYRDPKNVASTGSYPGCRISCPLDGLFRDPSRFLFRCGHGVSGTISYYKLGTLSGRVDESSSVSSLVLHCPDLRSPLLSPTSMHLLLTGLTLDSVFKPCLPRTYFILLYFRAFVPCLCASNHVEVLNVCRRRVKVAPT